MIIIIIIISTVVATSYCCRCFSFQNQEGHSACGAIALPGHRLRSPGVHVSTIRPGSAGFGVRTKDQLYTDFIYNNAVILGNDSHVITTVTFIGNGQHP